MSTGEPLKVTRRQFGTVATAAAAGWLVTACGPRRLREVPPAQLREAIARLERDYAARYAGGVTVADTPPLPSVEFAYALDLSRCVGCRFGSSRCVRTAYHRRIAVLTSPS